MATIIGWVMVLGAAGCPPMVAGWVRVSEVGVRGWRGEVVGLVLLVVGLGLSAVVVVLSLHFIAPESKDVMI